MVDTNNAQQARHAQQENDQVAAGAVTARSVGGRRVVPATCTRHGGSSGFTNIVMTKREGMITLDPHATGGCVLAFDEDAATAVRDQITEWLG